MRAGSWWSLAALGRHADLGLLGLRLVTGVFLAWGVWDNVVSAERMDAFSAFLATNGFAAPALMARLSVWTQLVAGVALVLGLATRWAGILVAVNFIIAVLMVHWSQDLRGWWPALVLVFLGTHFALAGGGRYALDHWLIDPDRGEVRR